MTTPLLYRFHRRLVELLAEMESDGPFPPKVKEYISPAVQRLDAEIKQTPRPRRNIDELPEDLLKEKLEEVLKARIPGQDPYAMRDRTARILAAIIYRLHMMHPGIEPDDIITDLVKVAKAQD